MKMTCSKCQISLKVLKVGVRLIEMFGKPPTPYRIWAADKIGCGQCGLAILVVVNGQRPIAENFQPDFRDVLKRALLLEHHFDFERAGDCLSEFSLGLTSEDKDAANTKAG